MEGWETSLIEERNVLRERLARLMVFLGQEDCPDEELLEEQSIHMARYLDILNQRIGKMTH